MTDSQNIQISLSLFNKITSIFHFIAFSDRYTFPEIYKFDEILSELDEKQFRINLRTLYTNAIYAKNDEQRNSARENYTKLKKRQ
jgi:hypothetical protein